MDHIPPALQPSSKAESSDIQLYNKEVQLLVRQLMLILLVVRMATQPACLGREELHELADFLRRLSLILGGLHQVEDLLVGLQHLPVRNLCELFLMLQFSLEQLLVQLLVLAVDLCQLAG